MADDKQAAEDIQVYNRDDPGVIGVEQIKSTGTDEIEVDIGGYRRGTEEAEAKLKDFLNRVSTDTFPKPKRFLLGSITKSLPTRITILVPMETYSLDEIFKNTNISNRKKKVNLGPPMFNFAEQKMRISKELLPEITNLIDERKAKEKNKSNVEDKESSRFLEEEKERIREFFKRITHEDDFIQNVFSFEDNYLGWILEEKHYTNKKKQRIVRSSMKLLFQFIFSDATINDANSFYQHVTIGYTKLFPKEKLPCNTDIRQDFVKCFEWRQRRLLSDMKIFHESIEITDNLYLSKMKEFEEEIKKFLKFVNGGSETVCMVYGNNNEMTIKQSPEAIKQTLSQGVTDKQAELLLRLLRNIIEESEETRADEYSYDKLMKMMKNMSKIPIDDEDREKDGKDLHKEILESLKMIISSNAEEQMKYLSENILILQEVLKLVITLMKAKHSAGVTPAGFFKKGFPPSLSSDSSTTPTESQVKEVKGVLETLSKQQSPLQAVAQSLLPVFTSLENGISTNIEDALREAVKTYEDVIKRLREEIDGLSSEESDKQKIRELEAQRKELEEIVNAVKNLFQITSTNPGEILSSIQENIQAKDAEVKQLRIQIAEKEQQVQQASISSEEKGVLQQQIQTLQGQVSTAEQQIIQLNFEKEQLQTQNQEKDSTIVSLQSEVQQLQQLLESRVAEITSLTQQITAAQAEVQAKDAALAKAVASAEAAAEAAARAAADAESGASTYAAIQAAQEAAETSVAVAQAEKASAQALLQRLQAQLQEAEAAKTKCDEDLARRTEELVEAQEAQEAHRQAKEEAVGRVKELEKQLMDLTESKTTSNSEMASLRQELEEKVKANEKLVELIRTEFEKGKSKAQTLETGLAVEKEEKERIEKEKQGEIEVLQQELQKAQEKLQQIEAEKTKTTPFTQPTTEPPSQKTATVHSGKKQIANNLTKFFEGKMNYTSLHPSEQKIFESFYEEKIKPKVENLINKHSFIKNRESVEIQAFRALFNPKIAENYGKRKGIPYYGTYGFFSHSDKDFRLNFITNPYIDSIYAGSNVTKSIWRISREELLQKVIDTFYENENVISGNNLNLLLLKYVPSQGGGSFEIPKQEICEGLLALFLQRMDEIAENLEESDDDEFTLQNVMDHAGATMDELGQCPFVLDLLMRLLEAIPKRQTMSNRKGLTYHKAEFDKKTQYQLEELEKAYSKYFSDKEQKVLTRFSPPMTLYSRTPEEYSELLGETPYVIEENDMDIDDDEIPFHGLEEDIFLTEDEQKKLENTGEGGIPLGALMFLYVTCLKEILAKEEHPTLNSKCPLLTPQRTVHRAKTPKKKDNTIPRRTHRKKSRGKL